MTRQTRQITVTTSAVRLDQDDSTPARIDPQTLTYYAPKSNTVTVWLGSASVAVGAGIALEPGGIASETLPPGERSYAIASAAAQVNVDQVGV